MSVASDIRSQVLSLAAAYEAMQGAATGAEVASDLRAIVEASS